MAEWYEIEKMTSAEKDQKVLKDSDRQREYERKYKEQARKDIWKDIGSHDDMYDMVPLPRIDWERDNSYMIDLNWIIIRIDDVVEKFKRAMDVGKSNVLLKVSEDALKEFRERELNTLFRRQLCTKDELEELAILQRNPRRSNVIFKISKQEFEAGIIISEDNVDRKKLLEEIETIKSDKGIDPFKSFLKYLVEVNRGIEKHFSDSLVGRPAVSLIDSYESGSLSESKFNSAMVKLIKDYRINEEADSPLVLKIKNKLEPCNAAWVMQEVERIVSDYDKEMGDKKSISRGIEELVDSHIDFFNTKRYINDEVRDLCYCISISEGTHKSKTIEEIKEIIKAYKEKNKQSLSERINEAIPNIKEAIIVNKIEIEKEYVYGLIKDESDIIRCWEEVKKINPKVLSFGSYVKDTAEQTSVLSQAKEAIKRCSEEFNHKKINASQYQNKCGVLAAHMLELQLKDRLKNKSPEFAKLSELRIILLGISNTKEINTMKSCNKVLKHTLEENTPEDSHKNHNKGSHERFKDKELVKGE